MKLPRCPLVRVGIGEPSRFQINKHKMNSNEMLDTMVNVIAEAVWQKLEPRINEKLINVGNNDEEFKTRVESVIDDIDFNERIDTDRIAETVKDDLDSDGAISDAVTDHFRHNNLKDYVTDALEEMDLARIIRTEVRSLTFSIKAD